MKRFRVKVKGMREGFVVSYTEGNTIAKNWANDSIPQTSIFTIGDARIQKSEINGVIPFEEKDEEGERQANDEKFSRMAKECNEEYLKEANKTPEEKAKRMEWFKTVYLVMSGGKKALPELKVDAYNRQIAFFKDNPGRTLSDPIIYKDLIPKPIDKLDSAMWGKRDQGMYEAMSRWIERTISNDRANVKYLFKK